MPLAPAAPWVAVAGASVGWWITAYQAAINTRLVGPRGKQVQRCGPENPAVAPPTMDSHGSWSSLLLGGLICWIAGAWLRDRLNNPRGWRLATAPVRDG